VDALYRHPRHKICAESRLWQRMSHEVGPLTSGPSSFRPPALFRLFFASHSNLWHNRGAEQSSGVTAENFASNPPVGPLNSGVPELS
jgi:hypothetical protein